MTKRIIYNAIRTPDGTVIESIDTHDYVTHIDAITGKEYMVDGGHDYLRRSAWNDATELSLYHDDDFTLVRQHMKRYNLFTNQYVPLCGMSDAWLDNLLSMFFGFKVTVMSVFDWYIVLLIKEKQYRIENEISIEEQDETITAKANKLKEVIEKRTGEKGYY